MTITRINDIDVIGKPKGTFASGVSGPCGTIHLLNESLSTVLVACDDGRMIGILPALWAGTHTIQNPPPLLNYTTISVQNSTDTTLGIIQGASYTQDEDTSKLYSGPLPRIANVGNPGSVSPVVTGASSIVNTGNPPATPIITANSTAIAGNSVTLTNDGILTLSTLIGGVLAQLIKTQAAGNPLLLGLLNKTVEILGALAVDQTLAVTGNATIGGTLGVTGTVSTGGTLANTNTYQDTGGNTWAGITPGATTRIATQTGGTIAFQINGANQATINAASGLVVSNPVGANGFSLNAGSFNYGMYAGSISRVSTGTYTSSTSSKAVNHGLGASPTNVMITGATSSGTATSGADTYGATTFNVIDGANSVSQRFRAERA